MPPKASPHFLGLQLSVDALRAAIVDEQLELVGSEQIDFDADFPEFKYVSHFSDQRRDSTIGRGNGTHATNLLPQS
jgi:hypothetical protein